MRPMLRDDHAYICRQFEAHKLSCVPCERYMHAWYQLHMHHPSHLKIPSSWLDSSNFAFDNVLYVFPIWFPWPIEASAYQT